MSYEKEIEIAAIEAANPQTIGDILDAVKPLGFKAGDNDGSLDYACIISPTGEELLVEFFNTGDKLTNFSITPVMQ